MITFSKEWYRQQMLQKVKKLEEPCGQPRAFGPALGKGHMGTLSHRKNVICDRYDMGLGVM